MTASKSGPSMISLLKPNKPDAGISLAWELIDQSASLSDELLVHLFVDRLARIFPQALLRTPWSTVMINLGQSFPGAFHLLLACLQDVEPNILEAFVDGFNLEELNSKIFALQQQGLQDQHNVANQEAAALATLAKKKGKLEGRISKASTKSHQTDAASSKKSMLSAPVDLVKSITKMTSKKGVLEEKLSKRQPSAWANLWNAPQEPEKSEGSKWNKVDVKGMRAKVLANQLSGGSLTLPKRGKDEGRDSITRINSVFDAARALTAIKSKPVDTYNTHAEDAASYKYTLYKQLVAGLEAVPYSVMKAFVERLDPAIMCEMAMMSVLKDFVLLLPGKIVGLKTPQEEEPGESTFSSSMYEEGSSSLQPEESEATQKARILKNMQSIRQSVDNAKKTGQELRRTMRRKGSQANSREALARSNESRVEVLNISRLLAAALTARSAESVESGVYAMVRWVEVNGAENRMCFLDGLGCDLIEEMATNFPNAATNLLNIAPQSSRHIQVSSSLLGSEPVIYRCSKTRYSFMWRQAELRALLQRGYSLEEVEMLADHSMRFMYICRAAHQGTTVDELLELMDLGLSGKHIADLVSSGAQLSRVKHALNMGIPAELVASMLENKLSFQIIDILLTHPVQRTTIQDRSLLLELLQTQVDIFSNSNQQHFTLGYPFVTSFLEKWAALNWDKSYLDKVFHISDTLTTKLKTAHDYKLTMRTQYQLNHPMSSTESTRFFDWSQLVTLGMVFMEPGWLVTRFVTLAVFLCFVASVELAYLAGTHLLQLLPQQEVLRLMKMHVGKSGSREVGGSKQRGDAGQHGNPLSDGRPGHTSNGLPPGVLLPGFGGARTIRGRGQRPPRPKPQRLPWWRRVLPKNKVVPKGELERQSQNVRRFKDRTMDAMAKVLPLLHIGALGDASIVVGLVKADVPASWYVTPVVRAIVNIQWASFAKVLMALHLLEHILLMCFYGAFLLLIHRSFEHETEQARVTGEMEDQDMVDDERLEMLLGKFPIDQHRVLDTIGGGIVMAGLALFTISMIVTRLMQLKVSGIRLWAGNFVNLVDILSALLIIAIFIVFAVPGSYALVLSIGALEVLILFTRLLFFSAIAEQLGSLVRTVVETIKDVRYFFILLGILYGGFSIAFNMQLGGDSEESQPTAVYLFTTMVGDFSSSFVLSVLQDEGSWLVPDLAAFLWCVYGFLMSVVLLTLLVAIMNDTYNRIRDAEEAEVLRLKARIIADLQSLLSPGAVQDIQDKTLGPFLHQLSPVVGENLGASKAQAEHEAQLAQMRMMVRSEVRNALASLSKQGILGTGASTAAPAPAPSGRGLSFADAVSEASKRSSMEKSMASKQSSLSQHETMAPRGMESELHHVRQEMHELKELLLQGMQAHRPSPPESHTHTSSTLSRFPSSRGRVSDMDGSLGGGGTEGSDAAAAAAAVSAGVRPHTGWGRTSTFGGSGRSATPSLAALKEEESEGTGSETQAEDGSMAAQAGSRTLRRSATSMRGARSHDGSFTPSTLLDDLPGSRGTQGPVVHNSGRQSRRHTFHGDPETEVMGRHPSSSTDLDRAESLPRQRATADGAPPEPDAAQHAQRAHSMHADTAHSTRSAGSSRRATETGDEPGAEDSEAALGSIGGSRQRSLPREGSGISEGNGGGGGVPGGRSLRRAGSSIVRKNAATAVPFAPPADIEPPRESPAVLAARSGRTMLRQVSLPGRHFQRSIPSINEGRENSEPVADYDDDIDALGERWRRMAQSRRFGS